MNEVIDVPVHEWRRPTNECSFITQLCVFRIKTCILHRLYIYNFILLKETYRPVRETLTKYSIHSLILIAQLEFEGHTKLYGMKWNSLFNKKLLTRRWAMKHRQRCPNKDETRSLPHDFESLPRFRTNSNQVAVIRFVYLRRRNCQTIFNICHRNKIKNKIKFPLAAPYGRRLRSRYSSFSYFPQSIREWPVLSPMPQGTLSRIVFQNIGHRSNRGCDTSWDISWKTAKLTESPPPPPFAIERSTGKSRAS